MFLSDRSFLWNAGQDAERYRRFRVPTEEDAETFREAAEIPIEEVANAAAALLKVHVSLPLTDLARETARQFGFERMGPKVQVRMVRGFRPPASPRLDLGRNERHHPSSEEKCCRAGSSKRARGILFPSGAGPPDG